MSERALKQLVGALAVAAAVWIVTSIVAGGRGSITASGDVARVFDGVTPASVQWVAIRSSSGDSALLERDDGGWSVDGLRADPAAVARLLEAFGDARVTDLAATNPANHERMGVSDEGAVTLTVSAGGRERTVLVGAAGRRFGTAYVRLPGDDDVYLLEGDVRAQVTRDPEQWRDRTMVTLDTARVDRIEVERGGGTYTLVRGDSVWTVDGDGAAAEPALRGLLSELARLVATGFVAPGDSLASLPAASVTRAYDGAGAMLAQITIGSGETDRWARSSSDDYLYRVSAFRADRVAPQREALVGGS